MECRPFVLLVLSCQRYHEKAALQRATWLTPSLLPENVCFYHVIGDPALATPFQFDEDARVLWVRVEDDYNSLPKKVVRAYAAVHQTFHFKYIFKTDDDQQLLDPAFFTTLVSLLETPPQSFHYGGYLVHVTRAHQSTYHQVHPELPAGLWIHPTVYCSGRFYFLSNAAIQTSILPKREQIEAEFFEDYAIGFHLDAWFKTPHQFLLSIATNRVFQDAA